MKQQQICVMLSTALDHFDGKAEVPTGTLPPAPSWSHLFQSTDFSFGGDESILKLTVVMIAQPCAYTKKH